MNFERIKYFFPKVFNRLAIEKNRLWKYLPLERVSMCGYHKVNSGYLQSRLSEMLGEYDASIFDGIVEEERNVILQAADQSLRHEFDLLGSGIVHLDPINWHLDFKSGQQWRKRYYQELGFIKGADIKVPWELSRCQHLLWLGEAYLLTGEGKYAQEVIDVINWWIDDNPLMYTVNWKCAMDVAFRAVNWMFALNMIVSFEGFDSKFSSKVMKSIWQHGFFIKNNLEKQIPFSNNHYASDIIGLFYIGELFNYCLRGRALKRFALHEYIAEVRKQILPSGVHYERSISYHRLMTEMFSYPVYLLERTGERVPLSNLELIRRMYEYVASYTKPNGFAPLIADNDDARFVPFMKRDFRIHNYLNNPKSIENRFIACGRVPLFCSQPISLRIYEDAGIAIVRNQNAYLLFNNGGYSKYPSNNQILIGTHTHNDLLSFELALRGKDIIIDPGTFLYTSSDTDRNAFRATAKHSTIMVDDEEQNWFSGPFELRRNLYKGSIVQDIDGSIEGSYSTIIGKMQHKRRIKLSDNGCVITDTLMKEGDAHYANFYFHFSEGINPEIRGNELFGDDVRISFSSRPIAIKILDDTLSPSFGVLVHSKTGVVKYCFNNELQITTIIQHLNG